MGGLVFYLFVFGMGILFVLIIFFGNKILFKLGDWLLKVKMVFGFVMLVLLIFLIVCLLLI